MNVLEIIKGVVKKVGLFFSRLFEKDVVVKITSLCAAIIIWFGISISEYPTISVVIYNVPIEIALEGTYAEASGYQVMNQSAETVNVYITGDRGQVGNLTAEELVASASAENVMYAMDYNLPLEIQCSTNKDFEVTKIEPAFVNVGFDRLITKEIPVKPELSGISAADGFIMADDENIAVVPDTVKITGPAETIEEITEASVVIREDTALTKTTDFKTDAIKLYNNSTVVTVENESIVYDRTEFTVHVPVYGKRTVQLDVRITNAPDSFDISAFKEKLEFSVEELEVAVPNESIKDIDVIEIGTIDMREVDIDIEKPFTFSTADFLPDGYQDWNEVGIITVSFLSDGLVKRPVHITNPLIQLINAPSQFEFKIVTSGVTPIFIGSEESMEQLTYIDVIAQVDMLNSFDMEEGYHKLPVTFSIPAYDDVWCIGSDGVLSPKVTIHVTLKENN